MAVNALTPISGALDTLSDARTDALARAILAWIPDHAGEPAPLEAGAGHEHHIASRDDWPWLPTREHGHLAVHPYCQGCGGVKYVGSLRAMRMGGLVNLAADLRRALAGAGHKVTEAQMRLIVRRLGEAGVTDTFTHCRETQERFLLSTFAAFTRIDESTLASYLRSC